MRPPRTDAPGGTLIPPPMAQAGGLQSSSAAGACSPWQSSPLHPSHPGGGAVSLVIGDDVIMVNPIMSEAIDGVDGLPKAVLGEDEKSIGNIIVLSEDLSIIHNSEPTRQAEISYSLL